MTDEPKSAVEKSGEGLEQLIGEADELRQERRDLMEQVAQKKEDISILELKVSQAEQQARIRLGKPSRILLLLGLLGIAGLMGYKMLPTTVDLQFNSWKPGPAREVERLLKMIGLKTSRVSQSTGPLSILFDRNLGVDDRIKLRHFLDRLISAKPPSRPPQFYVHQQNKIVTNTRLIMEFHKGSTIFRDSGVSGKKQCVWGIPTRVSRSKGQPEPISARMSSLQVSTPSPAFEPTAAKIRFGSGYIYFRLEQYEHLFLMNSDEKARCAWAILLSADDKVLSQVLFPRLAKQLMSYKLGKGLF